MATLTPPPPEEPVFAKDFRFVTLGTPCEWAESYRPQGLHPVHFGDVLDGRYRIIRKLGDGSFSTAWLAIDTITPRYVTLKIQKAGFDESRSKQIESLLAVRAPHHDGSRFLVALLGSFTHEGPNGSHSCLVLEPMGPSAASILNAPHETYDPLNPPEPRRFSKDRVKKLLQQVLKGLQFLHDHGVVHADLHSGNLLFAIKDLGSVDAELLRQTPQNSQVDYLQRVDGKTDLWAPKYLAVAMPLSEYILEGDDEVIKISDMGSAFLESEPPRTVKTPACFRAPELILGCPIGKGIDIWSFGCLLFELITGMSLFQVFPMMREDKTIEDDHLIQLTDIIGPLPEPLISLWSRASLHYGPNGQRLEVRPDNLETPLVSKDASDGYSSGDGEDYEEESLEEDMDGYSNPEIGVPKPYDTLEVYFRTHKPPEIDEEEEKVIVTMLRHIFQYEPSERPSVADLLEHRWFVT